MLNGSSRSVSLLIPVLAVLLIIIGLIGFANNAYKNSVYEKGISLREEGKYDEAIAVFEKLNGYSDVDKQIIETNYRKAYAEAEAEITAGNYEEAKEKFSKLEDYADSKDRLAEIIEIENARDYKEAEKYLAEKQYDKALEIFGQLRDYSDSQQRIKEVIEAKNQDNYNNAVKLAQNGDYQGAKTIFLKLGNYSDSSKKAEEMNAKMNQQKYEAAEKLMSEGKYEEAQAEFKKLGVYSDASERAKEAADAGEEQRELLEIRKHWIDPVTIISDNSGEEYLFEFEWEERNREPTVFFYDSDGRHQLSVTSFSTDRIELYDSRDVYHTLTYTQDGRYRWHWESSSWTFR